MSEGDEFGECFGQSVKVTKRINGILRGYPEGPTVLKELIQNADDAGADIVKICYDQRSHPTTSLRIEGLAAFQGPSLCVYNSAVFTEEDYKSIQSIGDSKKEDSKTKTGRFGIGFNSVYHLTDIPSFVSGDSLVYFDPHRRYLGNGKDGIRVRFSEGKAQETFMSFPNTFAPFKNMFDCNLPKPYKGTLFRLPFRTQAVADKSEISHVVYDQKRVKEMLHGFREAADQLLIFLKNVERIEMFEWEEGAPSPRPLFTVAVNDSPLVRPLRQAVLHIPHPLPPISKLSDFAKTFELTIHTENLDEEKLKYSSTWLVTQHLGKGSSYAKAVDGGPKEFKLRLIPWAGAATLVETSRPRMISAPSTSSLEPSVEHLLPCSEVQGNAFVFLPLPIECGLHMHINGYFEISDTRREICFGDTMGEGKARSDWNLVLLGDAVADACSNLIESLCKKFPNQSSDYFHALFPTTVISPPWNTLSSSLIKMLSERKVLSIEGKWYSPLDVAFSVDSLSSSPPLLALLLRLGLVVLASSPTVLDSFMQAGVSGVTSLSPSLVRTKLKEKKMKSPTNVEDCSVLLEYVLSDSPTPSELVGLALLPMADGTTVRPVESKDSGNKVYVNGFDELHELLMPCSSLLLHRCCFENDAIRPSLGALVASKSVNLYDLSPQNFRVLLPSILPKGWVHSIKNSSSLPPAEIIQVACPACTFLNSPHSSVCEMCEASLQSSSPKKAPISSISSPKKAPISSKITPTPSKTAPPPKAAPPSSQNSVDPDLHVVPPQDWESVKSIGKIPVREWVSRVWNYFLKLVTTGVELPSSFAPVPNAHHDPLSAPSVKSSTAVQQATNHPSPASKIFKLNMKDIIDIFGDLSLLPGTDSRLHVLRRKHHPMIDTTLFPQFLQSCLTKLGFCGVVDWLELPPIMIKECLHQSSPLGLIGLLKQRMDSSLSPQPTGANFKTLIADQTSALEKRALFCYLSQDLKKLSDDEKLVIKSLPILEVFSRDSSPSPTFSSTQPAETSTTTSESKEDKESVKAPAQLPETGSGLKKDASNQLLRKPFSSTFISLNDRLSQHLPVWIPPHNILIEVLDSDFVVLNPEMPIQIYLDLDLLEIPLDMFYLDYVFPSFKSDSSCPHDAEVIDSIMIELLSDSKLLRDSAQLVDELRTLRFVLTESGRRRSPGELFSPSLDSSQRLLLDGTDLFPCGVFLSEDILQTMQHLGMRKTLGWKDLLDVAKGLDAATLKANGKDEEFDGPSLVDEATTKRAFALFSYLNENCERIFAIPEIPKVAPTTKPASIFGGFFGSKPSSVPVAKDLAQQIKADESMFFDTLRSLRWIPNREEPLEAGIPWPSSVHKSSLHAPESIWMQEKAWFVSASRPILCLPHLSKYLEGKLKLHHGLQSDLLCSQMKALALNFQQFSSEPSSVLSSSSNPASPPTEIPLVRDSAVQFLAASKSMAIYQEMKAIFDVRPKEFAASVAKLLDQVPWVWVGDHFALLSHVSVQSSVKYLHSYLHVLSVEMNRYAGMLEGCGMKREFDARDYQRILASMYDASQKAPVDKRSLSDSDFKFVRDLILHIKDQSDLISSPIYAPNDRCELFETSTMVYNDSDFAPPVEHTLIHPDFSHEVARAIGVRALGRFMLDSAADEDSFEPYGQVEKLTSRLNGIIEHYPEGASIFKELVQNADDARASKVVFAYSRKQFQRKKLLGPEMAHWQGPAIYAFNDALFQERDFKNLSNLARSDKADDATAIGRFGCGFNSVYHFTDVPFFVSGEHFVILDPHRKYLPGSDRTSQPGRRIKFTGAAKLVDLYPDQFEPMRAPLFNVDFKAPFKGTLFRFPLRNEKTAATSEIKKGSPYSEEAIIEIINNFESHLSDLLLFLKHVKQVSMYVLDENDEPSLMFEVINERSNPVSVDNTPVVPLTQFLQSPSGESLSHPAFIEKLNKVPGPGHLPRYVCHHTVEVKQSKLQARITYHWAVSLFLGGEGSVRVASKKEYERLKLVPMAGCAALIGTSVDPLETVSARPGPNPSSSFQDPFKPHKKDEVSEDSIAREQAAARKKIEGVQPAKFTAKAFVALPLPTETGLPVHINGSFQVSQNRRDLWSGNDLTGDGKQRSEWNRLLLEDCVSQSYRDLIIYLSRLVKAGEVSIQQFYEFFPKVSEIQPWGFLPPKLYGLLVEAEIIYTDPHVDTSKRFRMDRALSSKQPVSGLAPPSQCLFYEWSLESKLVMALHRISLKMAICPYFIIEAFLKYCSSDVVKLTSSSVRKRLQQIDEAAMSLLFPFIKGPDDCRNEFIALVDFMFKDFSKTKIRDFIGLPFVPLLQTAGPCFGRLALLAPDGSTPKTRLVLMNSVESELFSSCRSSSLSLLHPICLEPSLVKHFLEHDLVKETNLCPMTLPLLCEVVTSVIPPHWTPAILSSRGAKSRPSSSSPSHSLNLAPFLDSGQWSSDIVASKPAAEWISRFCLYLSHLTDLHKSSAMKGMPRLIKFPGDDVLRSRIQLSWNHPGAFPSPEDILAAFGSIYLVHGCDDRLHLVDSSRNALVDLPSYEKDNFGLALRSLGLANVHPSLSGCFEPDLRRVVENRLTPSEILRALKNLVAAKCFDQGERATVVRGFFESMDDVQRRAIFEYFAKEIFAAFPKEILNEEEKYLLSLLPVFEVFVDSPQVEGAEEQEQESLRTEFIPFDPARAIPPSPNTTYSSLLGSGFYFADSIRARTFLTQLGAVEMKEDEFLQKAAFSKLSQFEPRFRDRLMIDVLSKLPMIEKDSPDFPKSLMELPFVPDKSGRLHRPKDMFSPSLGSTLTSMIHEPRCYVESHYAEPKTLRMLEELGLCKELNLNCLLIALRELGQCPAESRVIFANEIYKFITKNLKVLISQEKGINETDAEATITELFATIKQTPFIRVFEVPQKVESADYVFPLLPLPIHCSRDKASEILCAPVDCRSEDDAWLVSSSLRVACIPECPPFLTSVFGWEREKIDPLILIRQILALNALWLEHEERARSQLGVEFLWDFISQIYELLGRALKNTAAGADATLVALMRKELKSHPWIWTGDHFISEAQFALEPRPESSPEAFEPLLYTLASFPEQIQRLIRPLLEKIQVRPTFSMLDYALALSSLAQRHEKKPLSPVVSPVCVQLLLALGACTPETIRTVQSDLRRHHTLLYALNKKNVLCPTEELCFNDSQWMKPEQLDKHNLVHESLNNPKIASSLRIRSLQAILHASKAFAADVPCNVTNVTLRPILEIERNLRSRGGDETILFDHLLEFADQAYFPQISFSLDLSSYDSTSVLLPSLSTLQGPSLVVRLHGAAPLPLAFAQLMTPSNRTSAGGHGLPACFAWGDVVQVLLNRSLIIFDPSGELLKVPDEEDPQNFRYPSFAKSYDLANPEIFNMYPDQFAPFLPFGFEPDSDFQGVLIRIPLRATPGPTNLATSKDQAVSMLDKFRCHGVQSVLFSLRLQTVELFLRASEVQLQSLSVKTRPSKISATPSIHEVGLEKHEQSGPSASSSAPISVHGKLLEDHPEENVVSDQDGAIAPEILLQNSDKEDDFVEDPIGLGEGDPEIRLVRFFKIQISCSQDDERRKLRELKSWAPYLSITGKQYQKTNSLYFLELDVSDYAGKSHSIQRWALCQALGSDRCQDFSINYASLSLKPLVGCAAIVFCEEQEIPSDLMRTKAPCSYVDIRKASSLHQCIPLAINTGLPVHLFGWFQLDSAQKFSLSDWNNLVLESLTRPYHYLLRALVSSTSPVLSYKRHNSLDFYRLWPDSKKLRVAAPLKEKLSLVVAEFYKKMAECQVFFLSDGSLIPISDGFFLTSSIGPLVKQYICEKFANFVQVPKFCIENLQQTKASDEAQISGSFFPFAKKSKISMKEITPASVRKSVRDNISRSLDSVPVYLDEPAPQLQDGSEALSPSTTEGPNATLPPSSSEAKGLVSVEKREAAVNAQIKLLAELLLYCSEDITSGGSAWEELRGLPLVVLSNGRMVQLGAVEASIVRESEMVLAKDGLIVHPVMAESLVRHPRCSEFSTAWSKLKLKRFGISTIVALLPGLGATKSPSLATVEWLGDQPPREWLHAFWAFVTEFAPDKPLPEYFSPSRVESIKARCADVGEWCLLPTRKGTLAPLRVREAAIVAPDPFPYTAPPEIISVYENLGVVVVNPQFIECIPATGSLPPLPSEGELWPQYLCSKLGVLNELKMLRVHGLEAEDQKVALFEYLLQHEKRLERSDSVIQALRKLPIYPSWGKKRVSMTPSTRALSPMFSSIMQQLPDADALRFLDFPMKDAMMGALYSYLKFSRMKDDEAMIDVVLPRFGLLEDQQQMDIMCSMKDRWMEFQSNENLKQALKETPCVLAADGTMSHPSAMVYVKDEPFREIFCSQQHTTPHPSIVGDVMWLQMLSDLGMKTSLNDQMFEYCCELLEAKRDYELCTRFMMYVNANLHNFTPAIFKLLSSRRVVPAQLIVGLEPENAIFRFSELCCPKDHRFVFMLRPVIASALLPTAMFWPKLGLQSPPPVSLVVQNLKSIKSEVLQRWIAPHGTTSIEETFIEIFSFLSEKLDKLDPREASLLQKSLDGIPMIPLSSWMVPCSQVFLSLREPLNPYFFELPPVFHPHKEFLVKFGVREAVTVKLVVEFVENLAKSYRSIPLSPSQLIAFTRLLDYILSAATAEEIASSPLSWIPDDRWLLAPLKHSVQNDRPSYLKRLSHATLDLHFVSDSIPVSLCERFGIQKLSSVIQERLVEPPVPVVDFSFLCAPRPGLLTPGVEVLDDGSEGGPRGLIDGEETLLDSSSVEAPLLSSHVIPEHQALSEASSSSSHRLPGFPLHDSFVMSLRRILIRQNAPLRSLELLASISSYNVSCCRALRSELLFHDGKKMHVLSEAPDNILYFMDHDSKIVWINIAGESSSLSNEELLLTAISQYIGYPVLTPLTPLLRVSPYEADQLGVMLDLPLSVSSSRGLPGYAVLDCDRSLLALLPTKEYYDQEVVAVKGRGGEFVYASIISDSTTHREQAAVGKHHKILTCVGDRNVPLLPSEIWSFKDASEPSPTLPSSSSSSSNPMHRIMAVFAGSERAKIADPVPQNPPQDHENRFKVSNDEYIGAIKSLLLQGNLPPLNESSEKLMRDLLELRQLHDTMAAEMTRVKASLDEAETKLDSMEEQSNCPVCMMGSSDGVQVDVAFVPCGHVLCGPCADQIIMTQGKCPTCKKQIQSKLRIFK